MNGASVASASGDAGFVLYHDDRYARLDAATPAGPLALGEDPTEGYNPPVAARPANPSRRDRRVPLGRAFVGLELGSDVRRFRIGAAFGWVFFLIIGAIMVVVRVLKTLARGATQLHRDGSASYTAAIGGDPSRPASAARLAELQDGGGAPEPAAYQPPAAAAVRGFGRKGA